MKAVTEALMEMHENADNSWNRDTTTKAYSLSKSTGFQFIVTLIVTQRVFAFTSGRTVGLQTRGIDLANVVEQVKLVIRALQSTRDKQKVFIMSAFNMHVIKQNVWKLTSKSLVLARQTII